ncbi:uncharacterized protein LOC129738297 isoform X2 [Uranotaenia lowii]|uniref:uncharacterized protein LOC129738297 isoform X2 n=1 Tax=Uranotaenia lowii TaxID=190385 RepID=UPI002479BEC5|nr:uncharacterized protein LOC129738297 isoform X2 [Uranotaenia lowii]
MIRNQSSGGGGGMGPKPGQQQQAGNVQPGRVMIILRDPKFPDDMILEIARQFGAVKGMHRPDNNHQMVFIQFEEPECAGHAIAQMRNYPVFFTADFALRHDREKDTKNNPGGQKNANQHRQNKGGQNNRPFNGPNNNGNYASNSSENESPQKMSLESQMPAFPLGCWNCTKMPNFECQCGAYYCDAICQRTDWPRHKAICMPRLVPISYSNKRMLAEANAFKEFQTASLHSYSNDATSNYGNDQGYQNHQDQNRNKNKQQHQNNKQNKQQNQNYKNQSNRSSEEPAQNNSHFNKKNNENKNKNDNKRSNKNDQKESPKGQPQSVVSPKEDNKVSMLSNKLERLKVARSTVGANKPAVSKVLKSGRFPPEGARVKITATLPSGVVYIYHINGQGGKSEYYELNTKLHIAAQDADPLQQQPKIDDIIFAPFECALFRSKVLATGSEEKITIQYLEFGNSGDVSWKECRSIVDESLKFAPLLTFPVALEGVGIGQLTKPMKEMLISLEHTDDLELMRVDTSPDSDVREVVLRRPKQSETLNMQLMEMRDKEVQQRAEKERQQKEKEKADKEKEQAEKEREKRSAIADPSTYKPVFFDEAIRTKQLEFDKVQRLFIVDASEVFESNIISVITGDDLDQYGQVVDQLTGIGPKDPNPYMPTQEGEVVIVRYEGADWSRALFDIKEGNFLLLDIGSFASIPKENIRRFPPGLSRVVYNNEVEVKNLDALKGMMTDGKPESVHGRMIEAMVNSPDEGIATISIIVK